MNTLSITSTKTMTYNEKEALRALAVVETATRMIVAVVKGAWGFTRSLRGFGASAPRKVEA